MSSEMRRAPWGFERFEGGGDALDTEGNVVEAFAAFQEEAANRRVGGGGLEELDAGVAGWDHGGADVLLLDGFLVDDLEAEGLIELGVPGRCS